ncbi:TPA: hypothetical protein ACH3X3_000822 [Trebouxia sp. C0006]
MDTTQTLLCFHTDVCWVSCLIATLALFPRLAKEGFTFSANYRTMPLRFGADANGTILHRQCIQATHIHCLNIRLFLGSDMYRQSYKLQSYMVQFLQVQS